MSDQFYGEIRMFAGYGGQSSIRNWAFCVGTILRISDHGPLYSLIGTTYGGDGVNTFALPDMRGRLPVHQGTGPGLTTRVIGQRYGTDEVTLTVDNLPSHNHPLQASNQAVSELSPSGAIPGVTSGTTTLYDDEPESVALHPFEPSAVGDTGQGAAHDNCMPCLGLSFIIALAGIYPDRP